MARRLRIVNDTGLGAGTKVIDVETGVELTNVTKIDVRFRPGEKVVAVVEVWVDEIDIIAEDTTLDSTWCSWRKMTISPTQGAKKEDNDNEK